MSLSSILIIGIHSLIAWILVEVFVNTCHFLSRKVYILLHYLTVIVAFFLVFAIYFSVFHDTDIFWTTMTACSFILLLELIVFRYLYSGDRWFLNWIDWIFPLFLAVTAIYSIGTLLN